MQIPTIPGRIVRDPGGPRASHDVTTLRIAHGGEGGKASRKVELFIGHRRVAPSRSDYGNVRSHGVPSPFAPVVGLGLTRLFIIVMPEVTAARSRAWAP